MIAVVFVCWIWAKVLQLVEEMELYKADDAYRQRVYKHFNRTEESINEDVEILRKWLQTQKHLPEILEDDKIRNFLLLNKCSIEITKKKIDMYYTIRSILPDVFVKSNPTLPCWKDFADTTYVCGHPKLHLGMHRMAFIRMKKTNVCEPLLVAADLFNWFEVRLKEDCVFSDILFVDAANTSLEDLMKFTPSTLKKIYMMFNSVFSLRMKEIHILNSVPYIGQILAILKVVVKDKIFQRIHVHQNSEVLTTYFNKDELPKDYGGEGPSLQEISDLSRFKFPEYKDRFDELDKLRVDESLRPTPLDNDEMLGFHGNFKKLNVD